MWSQPVSDKREVGDMILIIGGAFQGKTALAEKLAEESKGPLLLNVEERIREGLLAGRAAEELGDRLLSQAGPQGVLTAREIGCGIVPADAFERKWREATGRILCRLAQKADTVYRVTAGLPQKIKG